MMTNCSWVKDLMYLNDSKAISSIPFHSDFKFPNDFYIIKTDTKDYLVKIRPRSGYYNYSNKFKSLIENNSIKDLDFQKHLNGINEESIVEFIFEGQLETLGYDHPIKFTKNSLIGYWPQNKEAKYKTVSEFNGLFAKIEMPDGSKGWLDIHGTEYFF